MWLHNSSATGVAIPASFHHFFFGYALLTCFLNGILHNHHNVKLPMLIKQLFGFNV
jgi:hypothetical protein